MAGTLGSLKQNESYTRPLLRFPYSPITNTTNFFAPTLSLYRTHWYGCKSFPVPLSLCLIHTVLIAVLHAVSNVFPLCGYSVFWNFQNDVLLLPLSNFFGYVYFQAPDSASNEHIILSLVLIFALTQSLSQKESRENQKKHKHKTGSKSTTHHVHNVGSTDACSPEL